MVELKLKIYQSSKEVIRHNIEPGKFISNNKDLLKFAVADGFIHLHELQLQGKKRMSTRDFLNGYKL